MLSYFDRYAEEFYVDRMEPMMLYNMQELNME